MKLSNLLLSSLSALFLLGATSILANAQDVDLTGIKCVINGKKAAKADAFVDYQKSRVYFCCQNCVAAFKKDVELKEDAKFTTKANHQLVLTGQFVQKGCPISGGAFKEEATTQVGGTKVGFCCEHCQQKVDDAKDLAAKAELVFSKAAFTKGFEKKQPAADLTDVKCMFMKDSKVSEKFSVAYKGAKVYFCCWKCPARFEKDKEKVATAANQQLVQTGQFVQTGCPISGGEVDDEQVSKVGGVEVKFCCHRCKGKVDAAADEKAKAELVFGEKRFDKAFSKK